VSANISLFAQVLPALLPNYRNPCWYESITEEHVPSSYHERAKLSNIYDIIKKRCTNIRNQLDKESSPECCRLRCFPYFFLIGAAKSGTTDMYQMLSTFHPNIARNTVKEPHYWSVFQRKVKRKM
jgi:hypothetical protein